MGSGLENSILVFADGNWHGNDVSRFGFSRPDPICEIGIRMALGACILWMVQRESLLMAFAGLLVGLPAALSLGHLIASYLYGVEPHDPSALIGAAVLPAAVCAAAGHLAARRAARVDPIRALHCE